MSLSDWKRVPIENEVALSIELLREEARQIADGRKREAICMGGPGVGKTHTIMELLTPFRARGLTPIFANPSSYKDVLAAFDEAQATSGGRAHRVRPIYFDEADLILTSERCLNILKRAFEPDRNARIYEGQRVDAPVLISSNRPKDAYTQSREVHLRALYDRCPPIDIARDPYQCWQYAVYLALTTPMLRKTKVGRAIALDTQVRALEWFSGAAPHLTVVGPRSLRQATEVMAMQMSPHLEERKLMTMLGSRSSQFVQEPAQEDWRDLVLTFHL